MDRLRKGTGMAVMCGMPKAERLHTRCTPPQQAKMAHRTDSRFPQVQNHPPSILPGTSTATHPTPFLQHPYPPPPFPQPPPPHPLPESPSPFPRPATSPSHSYLHPPPPRTPLPPPSLPHPSPNTTAPSLSPQPGKSPLAREARKRRGADLVSEAWPEGRVRKAKRARMERAQRARRTMQRLGVEGLRVRGMGRWGRGMGWVGEEVGGVRG